MSRLGRGEYSGHQRDALSSSVEHGRVLLVVTMEWAAPQVHDDLDEQVANLSPRARPERLLNAIDDWARNWCITDNWLKDQLILQEGWGGKRARKTLGLFRNSDSFPRTDRNPRRVLSPSFSFSFPPADLDLQTLQELKAEIRNEFEAELESYTAKVRSLAQRKGWQRTVEMRGVDLTKLEELFTLHLNNGLDASYVRSVIEERHFHWLVRYHFLRETYQAIQEHPYSIPENRKFQAAVEAINAYKIRGTATIADAVRGLAKRLGLTLRTSGIRGRPKLM